MNTKSFPTFKNIVDTYLETGELPEIVACIEVIPTLDEILYLLKKDKNLSVGLKLAVQIAKFFVIASYHKINIYVLKKNEIVTVLFKK